MKKISILLCILLASCTQPKPLPELEAKKVTVIRVWADDFMDVEYMGSLYRVEGPFLVDEYYRPGQVLLVFLPKE